MDATDNDTSAQASNDTVDLSDEQEDDGFSDTYGPSVELGDWDASLRSGSDAQTELHDVSFDESSDTSERDTATQVENNVPQEVRILHYAEPAIEFEMWNQSVRSDPDAQTGLHDVNFDDRSESSEAPRQQTTSDTERQTQTFTLTPAQIATLSEAQVAGMTRDQLRSLSAEQIAAIRPEALNAIPSSQLRAIVTDTWRNAITTRQLAGLSPEALATITGNFAAAQLTADRITQIAPSTFATISNADLQRLLPAQVATMTAEQLGGLSTEQRWALRPEQVDAIPPQTIEQIEGASAFSDFSIRRSTAEQFAQMDATRFSPETIRQLGPAQLRALTAQQLASLDSAQLGAFSFEQARQFSQHQLSAVAPEIIIPLIGRTIANGAYKELPRGPQLAEGPFYFQIGNLQRANSYVGQAIRATFPASFLTSGAIYRTDGELTQRGRGALEDHFHWQAYDRLMLEVPRGTLPPFERFRQIRVH